MNKQTAGTIVSVKKQWWLKINTKPIRTGYNDGAIFPHIIKAVYTVNGTEYAKRKWIAAHKAPPEIGETVKIIYCEENPRKAKII